MGPQRITHVWRYTDNTTGTNIPVTERGVCGIEYLVGLCKANKVCGLEIRKRSINGVRRQQWRFDSQGSLLDGETYTATHHPRLTKDQKAIFYSLGEIIENKSGDEELKKTLERCLGNINEVLA